MDKDGDIIGGVASSEKVIGVLTGSYGAPRTVTATLEYRFF